MVVGNLWRHQHSAADPLQSKVHRELWYLVWLNFPSNFEKSSQVRVWFRTRIPSSKIWTFLTFGIWFAITIETFPKSISVSLLVTVWIWVQGLFDVQQRKLRFSKSWSLISNSLSNNLLKEVCESDSLLFSIFIFH